MAMTASRRRVMTAAASSLMFALLSGSMTTFVWIALRA